MLDPQTSPPPNPSGPAVSALPPSPTPVVTPQPESRLDQLAAEYAVVKPQLDALTEQLKGVTTAIKAELAQAHPGRREVVLTSPHLAAPLQLQAVTRWAFDTRRCKETHPQVYAAFARQSTSWTLRALAG